MVAGICCPLAGMQIQSMNIKFLQILYKRARPQNYLHCFGARFYYRSPCFRESESVIMSGDFRRLRNELGDEELQSGSAPSDFSETRVFDAAPPPQYDQATGYYPATPQMNTNVIISQQQQSVSLEDICACFISCFTQNVHCR